MGSGYHRYYIFQILYIIILYIYPHISEYICIYLYIPVYIRIYLYISYYISTSTRLSNLFSYFPTSLFSSCICLVCWTCGFS